jgi:hypothetical protein
MSHNFQLVMLFDENETHQLKVAYILKNHQMQFIAHHVATANCTDVDKVSIKALAPKKNNEKKALK